VSNRILIVDDQPANVLLLQAVLADVADEMLGLTDSKAAEQAFIDFMPDLVLLDLRMPEPDGFEVMRRLQRIRERQDFVPVIVLTADASDVARVQALDIGADAVLAKPLDQDEVISQVRLLLQARHRDLGTQSNERLARHGPPASAMSPADELAG
jgi:DNA-binding response OmpR family regulator